MRRRGFLAACLAPLAGSFGPLGEVVRGRFPIRHPRLRLIEEETYRVAADGTRTFEKPCQFHCDVHGEIGSFVDYESRLGWRRGCVICNECLMDQLPTSSVALMEDKRAAYPDCIPEIGRASKRGSESRAAGLIRSLATRRPRLQQTQRATFCIDDDHDCIYRRPEKFYCDRHGQIESPGATVSYLRFNKRHERPVRLLACRQCLWEHILKHRPAFMEREYGT